MTTTQSTLRSIALDQPATIRVFERFHLDYCCGGDRPLALACVQKGIDPTEVLAALADATRAPEPASDFTEATLSELIHHIVRIHHAYVRSELPRLLPLAERVAAKHGPGHPEVIEIEKGLCQLAGDLLFHLDKEEKILFPYIEALEKSRALGAIAPRSCFASVESPIQSMLHEHEAAGALLDQMRTASRNFAAPAGACPTYVGLYDGLDAFEKDLHRHVHLENNLLFPRAIALEQEVLVGQ
ncbi:MAG: iron-sulfur cluster repair di-iron protein [Terracidiphilus sp.]|jgi:regulator of cell morphogenesis and NO signaling